MDIFSLFPTFGNLFYAVAAFIVALSVIVAVHEFGHYIVGRWCGIYSEVFSLGFGPVLFSRYDARGTRWQVAALPFGGYVKFLGDAGVASDRASDDLGEMDAETRRHTMHGAPLWARAATVVAGPLFNFVLSILIFTGFALGTGVATEPPRIAELYPLPTEGSELREGDAILAVEGIAYPADASGYLAFADALPARPLLTYTVERDGARVEVSGPPLSPSRVANVGPDTPADKAGLREGDVILSLNGIRPVRFDDMIAVVNASGGAPVVVEYWRPDETGGGSVSKLSVVPERRDVRNPDGSFETRWLLGVGSGAFYAPATRTPGAFEALSIGAGQTWNIVEISLSGLYNMAAGAISSCGISGPIGIAKSSGQAASQGVAPFVWFIALLSTAVGMLNLFPIPILDGGHLLFHAYEAIARKPPSDRALRVLMGLGLAFLLSLMVFALGNDLFCR